MFLRSRFVVGRRAGVPSFRHALRPGRVQYGSDRSAQSYSLGSGSASKWPLVRALCPAFRFRTRHAGQPVRRADSPGETGCPRFKTAKLSYWGYICTSPNRGQAPDATFLWPWQRCKSGLPMRRRRSLRDWCDLFPLQNSCGCDGALCYQRSAGVCAGERELGRTLARERPRCRCPHRIRSRSGPPPPSSRPGCCCRQSA